MISGDTEKNGLVGLFRNDDATSQREVVPSLLNGAVPKKSDSGSYGSFLSGACWNCFRETRWETNRVLCRKCPASIASARIVRRLDPGRIDTATSLC